MRFGTKKSEVEETDSDGMYLRNFKDGDTKVRFLQETDDWIEFREHYTADKKSYPCTRDKDTCPGCTSDSEEESRSSRKYACNIHVVKGNYVAPFRIPVSLAKKMFTRSERNEGTITNRDYIVIRSGKFLETEYDVEGDDTYKVDLKTLMKDGQDIEEILAKSFAENAPGNAKPKGRFEDDDDKPRRRTRPIDEDSDEVVPRSARSARKLKDEDEDEEFPSKAGSQSESAGDSVEIDEDELFEMTIPQLKDLAVKAGVDVPSGAKKSSIIRLILDSAE